MNYDKQVAISGESSYSSPLSNPNLFTGKEKTWFHNDQQAEIDAKARQLLRDESMAESKRQASAQAKSFLLKEIAPLLTGVVLGAVAILAFKSAKPGVVKGTIEAMEQNGTNRACSVISKPLELVDTGSSPLLKASTESFVFRDPGMEGISKFMIENSGQQGPPANADQFMSGPMGVGIRVDDDVESGRIYSHYSGPVFTGGSNDSIGLDFTLYHDGRVKWIRPSTFYPGNGEEKVRRNL